MLQVAETEPLGTLALRTEVPFGVFSHLSFSLEWWDNKLRPKHSSKDWDPLRPGKRKKAPLVSDILFVLFPHPRPSLLRESEELVFQGDVAKGEV